jgi:hypothetical protein
MDANSSRRDEAPRIASSIDRGCSKGLRDGPEEAEPFSREADCDSEARGPSFGAVLIGCHSNDMAPSPVIAQAEVLAAFAAHKDEVTAGYVENAKRG